MTIFHLRGCACEIDRLETGRYMVSVVANAGTDDQRVFENQFATYEQAHAAAHNWVRDNVVSPEAQSRRNARA